MAQRPLTVNDILDGHVGLDLECFDRIYLNGWVHNLQVSGQVVNFRTHHLGFPIPFPAILENIGLRFRKAVAEFAGDDDIALIRFAKGERKLEVMRPYLDRLVREGRCGVAVIGVAQEFQRVFSGTTYHPDAEGGGLPRFGYAKADRRVTAYYFYLVDEVFGGSSAVSVGAVRGRCAACGAAPPRSRAPTASLRDQCHEVRDLSRGSSRRCGVAGRSGDGTSGRSGQPVTIFPLPRGPVARSVCHDHDQSFRPCRRRGLCPRSSRRVDPVRALRAGR